MTTAALSLALAVLVAPAAPTRRLVPARPGASKVSKLWRWPAVGLAGVGGGLAVLTLLPVPAVLAAGLAVGCLTVRRRRRRAQRRCTVEAAALQDALDVLIGELRVGAHPVTAFEVAATEADSGADEAADNRVGAALRQVAARARLGADVATGLRTVALRSTLPGHWDRLAVCWQLAEQHGLAIAALLRTAQRDIVARERFSAKVHAELAGARTTAALLAGLPVVGLVLGQAIGAEPVRFLYSGGAGGWLLVIGTGLVCCGLLWSNRIIGGVVK
ncbi:type II secretion system F family protein [Mycolicibacterium thermoresistibile]